MPIYEYLCLGCNLKFEYLLRTNEKMRCPKCGQDNLKKLFSAFSLASRSGRGDTANSSAGCSRCTAHNCASCQG